MSDKKEYMDKLLNNPKLDKIIQRRFEDLIIFGACNEIEFDENDEPTYKSIWSDDPKKIIPVGDDD